MIKKVIKLSEPIMGIKNTIIPAFHCDSVWRSNRKGRGAGKLERIGGLVKSKNRPGAASEDICRRTSTQCPNPRSRIMGPLFS